MEFENGFGMTTGQEVGNLNKALEAGYAGSPDDQQGGGAFRVESLDSSLKVLTHTDQHVKFWKKIPKQKAYNTVEEYNQLLSYGSDGGGFTLEGELPQTEDSSYQRKASFVKFMGVTREVTHPMTLVNSAHGDVMNRMNQDGIMWMLKKIENGLFWGNSKLGVGGSEYVEYDGIDSLIDTGNTINLNGKPLEERHINFAAQLIIENYGVPTDLFLPYEVYSQFAQEFYDRQRISMPTGMATTAGTVVDKFNTHGGQVNMEPNIFLKATKALHQNATSPKAPTQPKTVTAALANGGGADFGTSGAGTYSYSVAAANRHGVSVATKVTSDVALTGADLTKGVELTIANADASTYPVDYYIVYRTEADGSNAYQIDRIPASANTAGATTSYVDRNETMPNTYTAFMGELTEQVVAFKQLAPLMKMDLAVLAPSYRWMILMYGVPQLYAPKKWCRIKNIKATAVIG